MKLINLCVLAALLSPSVFANVEALGVRSDFTSGPVNNGIPYFNGRAYPDLNNEGQMGSFGDPDLVEFSNSAPDRGYTVEVIEESFFFGDNSSTLTKAHKKRLDELALLLKEDPGVKSIRVLGFSSTGGKPTYNQMMSQRRADAVASYLKSRGVDVNVEAKGLGELTTLKSSDARRADLTIESEMYSE